MQKTALIFLGVLIMAVLSACGQGLQSAQNAQSPKGDQGDQGPIGDQGPKGDAAPIPESIPVVDFQGFYVLADSGYIEIVQDSGSLNDLTQIRLVIKNADASYSLMPLTSATNMPKTNDELYYFGNLTYAALNNVKNDSTNAVLTGSLFTFITLSKVDGALTIKIQISNGAALVFDHTLTEN